MEELPYLVYNCAKQIEDTIQGMPIYFITNEQSQNAFTCDFESMDSNPAEDDKMKS